MNEYKEERDDDNGGEMMRKDAQCEDGENEPEFSGAQLRIYLGLVQIRLARE